MGRRSVRQERHDLAGELRGAGCTWVEVADALRERWPELSVRASLRIAHGWTQQEAAEEWTRLWPEHPRSSKEIGLWENWPVSGRRPSLAALAKLARVYECDAADLLADVYCYRHLDAVNSGLSADQTGRCGWFPLAGWEPAAAIGNDEDMDRREFMIGAAAAAAVGVGPVGGRVGAADVDELRRVLGGLYALDDQFGGGTIYQQALEHLASVQEVLNTASYGPTVGRDLQVVAARLSEMAGWLAFDAGAHRQARYLFVEALSAAQVTGDERTAVLVMASMSLQASTVGNGREARDLAHGAQRLAQTYGSPRLLSLLAAREALGHACHGDTRHCAASLTRSEQLLTEPGVDDEDWLAFWGPADFHWSAASALQALGHTSDAEKMSRSAVSTVDPAYRRNAALYQAGLAEVLVSQGDLDEGAVVACRALGCLDGQVSSDRARSQLHRLRPRLEGNCASPAVQSYLQTLDAL